MQNRTNAQSGLLIWDAEGTPPHEDGTTVLWRQYANMEDPALVSIPQQVEERAGELRSCYLAWIHDLGEARIGGKRVIDQLELRSGFSYWWMSSLAQKFNASRVSGIEDAIKTLALERVIVAKKASSIVLVSGNPRLAACVQRYCRSTGLTYEWIAAPDLATEGRCTPLFYSLPHSWQAVIYLAWYQLKTLLCVSRKSIMPSLQGDVLFVDVLVHLDKRASECGRFISNYWTALVDKLPDWRATSSWLHIFFRHPVTPSVVEAQRLIDRFNESARGGQFHALIERPLSLRDLFATLRDYLVVRRAFVRLRDIDTIRPEGSFLDLWPLHAEEWKESLCGKGAMVNCLRLSLFESVVSHLPAQRIGVYILENQPWEMALVYAWRAAGHGVLIGTPHTTIRFWDLRYHYDARSYGIGCNNPLPQPDFLAVNGPAGRNSILSGGYPPERVTEVEALRFMHLLTPLPRSATAYLPRGKLRILVCGDFLAATNRQLIAWLEIAEHSLPEDRVIVFKPHPAYIFYPSGAFALRLKISEASLVELLGDCDVVFASNTTSAAVDAYCAGIPVVQMLDGATFNMSPLRGMPGVRYVSHPNELGDALCAARQKEAPIAEPYFFLDSQLPRWKKLLGGASQVDAKGE